MKAAKVGRMSLETWMALGAMAWSAVPAWSAALAVSPEPRAVAVSGVTPGRSVALFGASRGFNGFAGYYLRHVAVLADDDGDGAVRLEMELPLAQRSVFAAVDLASGAVGLAAPSGSDLLAGALSLGDVGAGGGELSQPRRWIYSLWVRPGAPGATGVWGAVLRDGGEADHDGAEDGAVRALLASFVAVDSDADAPPERLATGDVLVVIDPESLEISTLQLPE
jgi:hypothetical protein